MKGSCVANHRKRSFEIRDYWLHNDWARFLKGFGLLCTGWVTVLFAEPPSIVQQPAPVAAYPGQTVSFTVAAQGDPSPTYAWFRGTSTLAGETNATLVLINLTAAQAGSYSVRVSNVHGQVTSQTVTLDVLPLPTPRLQLEPLIEDPPHSNRVLVPLGYTASGQEREIRFSIAFNPETLTAPRFQWGCVPEPTELTAAPPASPLRDARSGQGTQEGPRVRSGIARIALSLQDFQLEEDLSEVDQGRYGIRIRTRDGATFQPGLQCLGQVVLDRVPETSRFDTRLGVVSQPIPPEVVKIDDDIETLPHRDIPPHVEPISPDFELDLQTGLILHRIAVSNPGATQILNARVLVRGLTQDSLGNPIRVFNAPVLIETNTLPVLVTPNLAPAETRTLLVEYYISDLTTHPTVVYEADRVASEDLSFSGGNRIEVTRQEVLGSPLYPEGALLIEFVTRENRDYFIQYADTLTELNDSTTLRPVFPLIQGTGSRVQWIDYGPPKTDRVPPPEGRFYRILEFR